MKLKSPRPLVDAPRSPVAGGPVPRPGVCGLGGRRLARTQAGDSWHWYNDDDDLMTYDDRGTCAPPPGMCARPRIT
jgi:hypothetical protein